MRGSFGIWRALQRARDLNLADDDEAPARSGPDGVTRRRVIAALAGSAAQSLPAAAPAQRRGTRVAVVGGGLAGLVALKRLRAAGVDATLFEGRGAVGGRTRRFDFRPSVRSRSPIPIDLGGQLVNSDHRDIRALASELGLRLVDRTRYGRSIDLQLGPDGAVIPEAELTRALRGIAARITADSDRLDRDYEGVAPQLDAISAAAYMDRHGLARGPARDALEAGLRTEYGSEAHEVSALELLFNLPTVDGERLNRISASDELYVVEGGAGSIAARLGYRLAAHIQPHRVLRSVTTGPDGVRLGFDRGEQVVADRVILALPVSAYRTIRFDGALPPLWREAFGAIELGQNEKLVVGHRAAPWRDVVGFGGALWSREGFSEAWDARSGVPRPGINALGYLIGGAQVAPALATNARSLAARFARHASRAVPALVEAGPPGFSAAAVMRTNWTTDPMSRGSYVRFAPGQLTRFAPMFATEEEGEPARPTAAGRLFLAGEWLSDAYPGYMNGAAQTGRIAAEALLATLAAAR